jgi:hypothetical protein
MKDLINIEAVAQLAATRMKSADDLNWALASSLYDLYPEVFGSIAKRMQNLYEENKDEN